MMPMSMTPWPPKPENLTCLSMLLDSDQLFVAFPVPVHELPDGDLASEVEVHMVDGGGPRLVPPDGAFLEPLEHRRGVCHLVPPAEVRGTLRHDLHERETLLLQRCLHGSRELVDMPRLPPGDVVRARCDGDLGEAERVLLVPRR